MVTVDSVLVDRLVARWEHPDRNAVWELVALYPGAATRIVEVFTYADHYNDAEGDDPLMQCERLPFGYWLEESYAEVDTIGDEGDECLAMVERLVRERRHRWTY